MAGRLKIGRPWNRSRESVLEEALNDRFGVDIAAKGNYSTSPWAGLVVAKGPVKLPDAECAGTGKIADGHQISRVRKTMRMNKAEGK